MENKKAKKIFKKLFVPITLILIVFALVSYTFNYFSTDRYVKKEATEDITEAFDDIKTQLYNFRKTSETDFRLEASSTLIDKSNDTKVYVYDENFNEIALFDNSVYFNNEITNFLSNLLMNYELEENVLTTINFNGKKYLANTYIASSSLNIKEKYFVVLQDLTEKKAFIRSGLRNIIMVQVFLLFASVLVLYKIARDLSTPITRLAEDSKKYIVGKGVTISPDLINIDEVETLRSVLYEMQQDIDNENKKKNTIYENVAHDLRTPLVSILGYADGLKKGIIKDQKKACDIIIKTGNELKEMIENILMLSRFDNDTYKQSYENLDLLNFIKDQVELMKVIDNDKELIVDSKVSDTIIYTDKKLLTRIIQNLLSNAIKYANYKVIISIEKNASTSYERDLRKHIGEPQYHKNYKPCKPIFIISISDDGSGINDKDIDNIFTRYYKGDNGHFGIGLAVVKNAVSILGGDIKVESTQSHGTTFRIIL